MLNGICIRFLSIFAPPFREKSDGPEKAHTSLYSLSVNLHIHKLEKGKREVAFAVLFVYFLVPNIMAEHTFLFLFISKGVQAQLTG